MDKRSKVVVLGLVQNDRDEILLTLRSDPKIADAHLQWDLPGGTVEFGEEPAATVIREVKEETGLTVETMTLMPAVSSKVWQHDEYQLHVIVLAYVCRYLNGTITLGDAKIAKCEWIPTKEISTLSFLPTTEKFIQHLLSKN